MKVPGLNLGEWLRRLGVKRPGWAPEMVETVFPVHVVSDASALVPPLLPPAAFAGGTFVVALINFGVLQFQARAPGGAFIRLITASLNGDVSVRWRLQAAFQALVGSANPTIYNFGPTPVQSAVQIGEIAALVTTATTDPGRIGFDTLPWVDEFFIPSGQTLYIECVNAGLDLAWSVLWTEVPVGV